jgi:short chain dehydrogenase
MKTEGNVIFITGGGSGIGRGFAEALHRLGNKVIISGRRKGHLAKTLEANPGMNSIELDVTDPESIRRTAEELISKYPTLNVLINNAGIMLIDDASALVDDELVTSTIATNLMGPIRITGALIAHLKKQESADHATIVAAILEYLLRICLLKIGCPQFGTGNLRGNREYWNTTAMTVEQTIDEVQVAGTTASGNDRQPVGEVSVCPSRKSGRLFMAHMNPFDFLVLADGVGEPVQ